MATATATMTSQPSSSLPTLLAKLASSLESAAGALPKGDLADNGNASASILPPADGISLLDVKNELFLSYLQNLVFIILVKLRQHRHKTTKSSNTPSNIGDTEGQTEDLVRRRLVSLRIYLEKGVRPLESKLKYQIDKVVRAADDAAAAAAATSKRASETKKSKQKKSGEAGSGSDEDDSEDGSEESESGPEEEMDELAYRPNLASFAANAAKQQATQSGMRAAGTTRDGAREGVYRPPRVAATVMPELQPRESGRNRPEKVVRSAAIDDYVGHELDGAPLAEPSIGTTIRQGGRRVETDRERKEQAERQAYEETNFMRLAPSKQAKQKIKQHDRSTAGWGADEFALASLGGGRGMARIEQAVGRRKRGPAFNDTSQRGSGHGDDVSFGGGGPKKRRLGGGRR